MDILLNEIEYFPEFEHHTIPR